MKSLLFCITSTSTRCSSMDLRTAFQRRSSSAVEIGLLRRSDSSAICLFPLSARRSLSAGAKPRRARGPAGWLRPAPELFGRQPRAFDHGFELLVDDLGVDP